MNEHTREGLPMLSAASTPLIAKICAAAVIAISTAGAVTYTVIDKDDAAQVEAGPSVADEKPDVLPLEAAVDTDELQPETTEPSSLDSADDRTADDRTAKEESDDGEPVAEEPADSDPPDIQILAPEDGSHHDEKLIVFEGVTEPGATVSAGPYPATVDDQGNWRIELILSSGANTATISSTDGAGNIGYDKITVWLDVDENETNDEGKKDDHGNDDHELDEVAFSATQKYGTCDAETPYDVFWGTATPKSQVTISSAYGSATADVSKKGEWEIKVYFPNAPRGQAFPVTVSADNGSFTFDFVAVEIADGDKPEGHDEK